MTAQEKPELPSETPPPACPSRRLRRLRSVVLWFCGLAIFFFLLFVFRAPLLNGAARAWMVNDPPVKADAIVVLGGGCLLYTSDAADDLLCVDLGGRRIIKKKRKKKKKTRR